MQIYLFVPSATSGMPPRAFAFTSDHTLCHSVAITFQRRYVDMDKIQPRSRLRYPGVVGIYYVYDQDTSERLGTAYELVVIEGEPISMIGQPIEA